MRAAFTGRRLLLFRLNEGAEHPDAEFTRVGASKLLDTGGTNVLSTTSRISTVSPVPSWLAARLMRRSSRGAPATTVKVSTTASPMRTSTCWASGSAMTGSSVCRKNTTSRFGLRNESVPSFFDHCHSMPDDSSPTSVSCQPSLKTTNRLSLCRRRLNVDTVIARCPRLVPASGRRACDLGEKMPTSTRVSPTYGNFGTKSVREYSIVWPGFHCFVGVGG
jgi:hypothetical protein